ncbi:helix-turn-helix transcriptional regulator [Desulfovibrio sp. JC022]|uniref:helix-turn-helix transcriptional regulator n=1 Tax=Desulfovibrio sp. JC022 TaxID=2593642 RepID=UPI0013D5B201|nr:helix-turn-helix transcriptional regulator [Desulfovibrio sp. JC022]NDV22242.1 helix-turn-helix transcriptional regulator [Desulfovibrio sp. JC022]
MLELTKKSTTEKSAELCLKVPADEIHIIGEALKNFLRLAKYEVREVNGVGEEIFSAEEVLPEPTPASNLRGARFREDLTQAELAAKVGVHKNHISDMEREVRTISIDMAKRLGKALNTSYKRFL